MGCLFITLDAWHNIHQLKKGNLALDQIEEVGYFSNAYSQTVLYVKSSSEHLHTSVSPVAAVRNVVESLLSSSSTMHLRDVRAVQADSLGVRWLNSKYAEERVSSKTRLSQAGVEWFSESSFAYKQGITWLQNDDDKETKQVSNKPFDGQRTVNSLLFPVLDVEEMTQVDAFGPPSSPTT